jgi:hypothetical protein
MHKGWGTDSVWPVVVLLDCVNLHETESKIMGNFKQKSTHPQIFIKNLLKILTPEDYSYLFRQIAVLASPCSAFSEESP